MSFSVCPVGCWCDLCQRLSLLQAQLNVPTQYSDYYPVGPIESWTNGWNPLPSPCQTNRKPGDDRFYDPSGVRVMTAEDLGLPLSKPPYHFWLGAEAA